MAPGSCLCGKVTYDIKLPVDSAGKPRAPNLCHCRMCRKITSAYTSANLTVPKLDFTLNSGQLKRVRTTHKDDGFEFSILFCPECGTSIYAEPHMEAFEDVVIIQAGTLDDEVVFEAKPDKELNTKHRLPWMPEIEGAEQKRGY